MSAAAAPPVGTVETPPTLDAVKAPSETSSAAWLQSHKGLLIAAACALTLGGTLTVWAFLSDGDADPPKPSGLGMPPSDPVLPGAGQAGTGH